LLKNLKKLSRNVNFIDNFIILCRNFISDLQLLQFLQDMKMRTIIITSLSPFALIENIGERC